jgi:hypothetical protein
VTDLKRQAGGLRIRIRELRRELATCTTEAQRISVQRAIDDAEWQLERLLTSK